MGDWEAADFDAKGKDYGRTTPTSRSPGTDGRFQWLADSFVLPKGAQEPRRHRSAG